MRDAVLKVDPRDNVLIALRDLRKYEQISFAGKTCVLQSDVPAKHKFATEELTPGSLVKIYGVDDFIPWKRGVSL